MKELREDVSLLESSGIGGLVDVVDEFVGEESNEEGVGVPVDFGVGESSVVESVFQGEGTGEARRKRKRGVKS